MPTGGVKTGRTEVSNANQIFQALYQMAQLYNGPSGAAFSALLGNGSGWEQFQQVLGSLGNLDIGSLYGNRGFNVPAELQPFLNGLTGGMEQANNILSNGGLTPNASYTQDRLTDLMSYGVPGIRDIGQRLINSGGWTPESAGLNEQAMALLANGGFTAPLKDMEKVGSGILATGGRTAESGQAINQFLQNITNGGQTAQTNQMFGTGNNLVSSGGFTPEMSGFMANLMAKMGDNGMTPEAKQLFAKAMGIVNNNGAGGALAPTDQVVSMARDAANTATRQKASQAIRMMNERTGGAIASGGDALASFSDQAAQAEAAAVRDATMSQQEQQLKQLLGFAGVAGDVTKNASALMGQYAGAGADMFRSASSNIGTGAGMMGAAEQIAADRFKTSTGGFNATMEQELQRLLGGAGMVNQANSQAMGRLGLGMDTSTRLNTVANAQAMNAMQALQGEAGLRLGAGDSLSRMFTTQSANSINALQALQGMAGTGLNFGLGQQGVDLQAINQQISQTLQGLGLTADVANQIGQQYLAGAAGLQANANPYFNLANTGLSGQMNLSQDLIRAAMQPSMWQQMGMSAFNAGLGALTGGLGGMFSGMGGGGGVSGNPAWNLPGGPG